MQAEPGQQVAPPALLTPQVPGNRVQPGHRIISGHVADAPPGDLKCLGYQIIGVCPGQPPVAGIAAQRRVCQLEQRTESGLGIHVKDRKSVV